MTDSLDSPSDHTRSLRNSWKTIAIGGAALVGLAACAYWGLKQELGPPPAEIASDPLLLNGRTLYLTRCVSCHGERGRGDGVLSKTMIGPKPRDFVEDPWKYGTQPEQVLAVVTNGAKGTSMSAWKNVYSEVELRAVSAYVYHLAGKPIPDALRAE